MKTYNMMFVVDTTITIQSEEELTDAELFTKLYAQAIEQLHQKVSEDNVTTWFEVSPE
jgi:hypothetical protein